ncbi:MAG: hypothetical protein ACREQ5_11495, partial [Candidatus Dormibacteria bacterium]
DALTPADNLERLRGAANDVIRTNLIAKMPFETRQANDAAAVKSLTPYYSGWMSSSDTRSGIALRLAANQLNGVPLARGLKPDNIHMISSNWRLDGAGPMQYDRPAGTDRLSEHVALTQGLRSTYNLNKASWDAEFGAAGHDVYRGVGKSEFRAAFGGDLPPAGARASFQPLQSVSDLKSVTKGFNNGAIIKFAGVRGDDVLVSHRYHAGPWHNGGGEKESIMFGNKHDWTVTHTAPGDADSGFVPVITMERAKE